MKQAIYILSLEHSGSTLLGLAISSHPKVISFGEVNKVINASTDKIETLQETKCLCGRTVSKCDFWNQVLNDEGLAQSKDKADAYEKIMRVFFKKHGDDYMFLDSSKIISNLSSLTSIKGLDAVKIIFLIKDVRSYTVSTRANVKKYDEDPRAIPSRRSVIKHWYIQNRAIMRHLDDSNLDYLLIGYEEFCLHTKIILDKICEYLKIEYDPKMLDLTANEGHQVFGNRMRKQPNKNKSILYDDRWFRDLKVSQMLTFAPKAWQFNLDYAYSNTQKTLWNT